MASLAEELKAFEMEEQALQQQQNEERLRARIAEKRRVIEELQRGKVRHENPGAWSFTMRDLPKLALNDAVGHQKPLDELLKTIDPGQDQQMASTTWSAHRQGVQGTQAWPTTRAWQTIPQPWQAPQGNTEMLLTPGGMPKGEKPLLIIDSVNNIVPQDEEETLAIQGLLK